MTYEGSQKGGLVTLERYGREHFARITKGGKRRRRYSARKPSERRDVSYYTEEGGEAVY